MNRFNKTMIKRIAMVSLIVVSLFLVYTIVNRKHEGGCCSIPLTKLANKNGLGNSNVEAFQTIENESERMGTDIPVSVTYSGDNVSTSIQYPSVPPTGDTLDMLKDQTFRPDCCPSTYSTSSGCACLSNDQLTFLSDRGGNRA